MRMTTSNPEQGPQGPDLDPGLVSSRSQPMGSDQNSQEEESQGSQSAPRAGAALDLSVFHIMI